MAESNNLPSPSPRPRTWFERWHQTPLYLRILGACLLGALVGVALERLNFYVQASSDATIRSLKPLAWAEALAIPSRLILRLLGALAGPMVLLAVVQSLMHAQLPKWSALKLLSLLVLNTLVAIFIGLAVANTVQPGKWADKEQPKEKAKELTTNPVQEVLDNVPKSLLGPFTDTGKVTSVIMIALAVGVAMRRLPPERFKTASDLVALGFDTLLILLYWIIEVIPLAVFGIVASIVAVKGFGAFLNLGAFVVAVLLALSLQATYYLTRIRLASWVHPVDVIRGMRDALVMAFSTASSTATMPVTYACLREKVGLRERSASLGALVGANFNNDGTALYQAMAALFVAQLTGHNLTLFDQFLVVLTCIAASVGAAGIPEAGQVTMVIVFRAVGLDLDYIAMLLTVDWFLDRCRTTINVMGDVNVSCILDGKTREQPHELTEQDRELASIA